MCLGTAFATLVKFYTFKEKERIMRPQSQCGAPMDNREGLKMAFVKDPPPYLGIKPFFDAFPWCSYKRELTILLFWSVNKEKSKQLEERKKRKQSQSGMVYIGAKVATLLFSFLNRQWGVRKGVGWMGQYISGTLCTVQYCTYVYKVA